VRPGPMQVGRGRQARKGGFAVWSSSLLLIVFIERMLRITAAAPVSSIARVRTLRDKARQYRGVAQPLFNCATLLSVA
ncbi:hypothetical protein, partial [Escherichia coli]|uniref:hypothetical protein n=1 Tax=Escherichia coli TaxID=562 RepID=UPI0028DFCF6C